MSARWYLLALLSSCTACVRKAPFACSLEPEIGGMTGTRYAAHNVHCAPVKKMQIAGSASTNLPGPVV
jgi:hypothetical protein